MYRAKESGRARVEIYADDGPEATRSRLRTSTELEEAIERQDLEIRYQPLVDLDTRTMVGIQAFVRWQHRTRGLLAPDELISMVADRGLVVPLGAWALEETCRQAVIWHLARTEAGMDEDRLNATLRVGALQLADPGFPALVARILDTTGLNPDRLWLGFNESTLVRDAEAVVGVLRSLRDLGLHLGVDGFGTGYSSLAYLKRCPVEALKVHRNFVRHVDRRSEDTAVVRAVMSVGEALGLLVVADGVDRWEQVTRLQALGCRIAQGTLLGKPLAARDIGAYPTDDLGVWHGLLEPSFS
jgi:EAL domain-containing protein (putative c-di-GMP-specific phosphodiesterase class I)